MAIPARRYRQGPVLVLVDAHNLIHADPGLRALMRDPVQARQALIERLQGRQALRLVCDGGPGGIEMVEVRQGITVQYSGRHSADDCIIAWVSAHPDARLAVVTDDGHLASRARAQGARVIGCDRFLAGLVNRPSAGEDPRRQPPAAHEVHEWMRWFGLDGDATGNQ